MDYWDAVDLWVHADWAAFQRVISAERCLYFSARATRSYWDAPYRDRCCLVFGNEGDGLPAPIRDDNPDHLYQIPMTGSVRSLNLATAAGIVLYEAVRQLSRAEGTSHAP